MMKKILYSAALIAFIASFVSCQKDAVDEKVNPDADGKVFTAVIDGNYATKTTIDVLRVKWENSDEININGSTYTAVPDGTDATKASFTKKTGADPSATYRAVCPASLYVSDHFELPSTLTYTAGKFNMPMYAESETTTLLFKNIFGVLKITVANTVNVKSIAVSSDLYMNGTFTVSDNKASVADGADANKTTTLSCAPSVAGTDFYIPVPAGTYTGKNLKVVLTKDDDSIEKMTTRQAAEIEIAAGSMYTFNFKQDGMFKLGDSTKKIEHTEGVL